MSTLVGAILLGLFVRALGNSFTKQERAQRDIEARLAAIERRLAAR
jgi:hypothetical protein